MCKVRKRTDYKVWVPRVNVECGVEGGERGRGVVNWEKFLAIGDSIPPNTMLKQEGFQLAEASFRQSLHKVLPSTTSYYKACTKYFPILLRTTKLAQSTSQYYFVLQSLRKVLPSTTSYYKACTQYFPILLRTTKLAQSTSQYYFLLKSLHKVLPRTTSDYKACTEYFPGLLPTTKLARSTSQH